MTDKSEDGFTVLRYIPIEAIVVPWEDPSRMAPAKLIESPDMELLSLAQSMESEGQLESIVVSDASVIGQGLYQVIAGRRRLKAAKYLQWKRIAATIHTVKTTDGIECDMLSLVENVVRKEPSNADLAHSFANMKAKLMGRGQRPRSAEAYIAVRLGLSPERVHALVRIKERLIPRLFLAFAGVGGLPLTMAEATRYAALPAEEQEEVWAEWRAMGGRRVTSEDDDNAPKRPVTPHQPVERIREEIARLTDEMTGVDGFRASRDTLAAQIQALRWVLSQSKKGVGET